MHAQNLLILKTALWPTVTWSPDVQTMNFKLLTTTTTTNKEREREREKKKNYRCTESSTPPPQSSSTNPWHKTDS